MTSNYLITKTISEDILSYLYVGQNTTTKTNVYIWEYKSEFLTPKLIKKLIFFAEKVSGIHHPNILPIIEYEVKNNAFFVICEHIPQFNPLSQFIEKKQNLKKFASNIVTQIMSAMLTIESNLLVHGNLNFYSIYITPDGTVKLTNILFPLLILKAYLLKNDIVDEGVFLAPEFLLKRKYSIRSDIYAFGVLLYVLYTQKWPFAHNPDLSILKKSLLKKYPSAKELNPKIPALIDQIINKCLYPDPLNRFSSFQELKETLFGLKEIQLPTNPTPKEPWIKKIIISESHLELYYKLKSYFNKLIIILPIVCVSLLLYIWYLNYVNSIPNITVPDVLGLPQEQAMQVLQEKKLTAQVIGSYVRNDIPPGVVVETKPPAGRSVKQNRCIRLFLAKTSSIIETPLLIGHTIEESNMMVDQDKLQIEVIDEEYSQEYPKGVITSQIPTQNPTFNIKEDKIQVTLSKGFPIMVDIMPIIEIGQIELTKKETFQVKILIAILENWKKQVIKIIKVHENSAEILSVDHLNPGEQKTKQFIVEKGDKIEIYYSDQLAYSEEILYEKSEEIQEPTHVTANPI